jgi:hypothetical protein
VRDQGYQRSDISDQEAAIRKQWGEGNGIAARKRGGRTVIQMLQRGRQRRGKKRKA